jgi:hypothetical protein
VLSLGIEPSSLVLQTSVRTTFTKTALLVLLTGNAPVFLHYQCSVILLYYKSIVELNCDLLINITMYFRNLRPLNSNNKPIIISSGNAINQSQISSGFKQIILRSTDYVPPLVYEILNFLSNTGNIAITNNGTSSVNLFKVGGAIGWDSHAYTSAGYTAPVTLEFNKQADFSDNGASYSMISLNEDPTTDANYTSLDYASYPYQTSAYSVYHNGPQILFGGTWSTSQKFYIVYETDGTLKHFNGGNLLATFNTGAGKTLYVDTSFYSVNSFYGGFSNIRVVKAVWNGAGYSTNP